MTITLHEVDQAVRQLTQWAAFEPNDLPLWAALRKQVGDYLNSLWLDGKLIGSKPENAYFVRCDATTTPQSEINAGRINLIIGIALRRPAEFEIAKIVQQVSAAPAALGEP